MGQQARRIALKTLSCISEEGNTQVCFFDLADSQIQICVTSLHDFQIELSVIFCCTIRFVRECISFFGQVISLLCDNLARGDLFTKAAFFGHFSTLK